MMNSVDSRFFAQGIEEPVQAPARSAASLIWDVVSVMIIPIGIARAACWGFGRLASKVILLSSNRKPDARSVDLFNKAWFGKTTEKNLVLRAAFKAEPIKVVTEDGITLSGTVYRSPGCDPQTTPTVICFNPNSALQEYQNFKNLMRQAVLDGVDCHFVTFNYRSAGLSEGTFTSDQDLVKDGSAMVQYVQKELKTPNPLIHFYGHSIGGAVAAKTKAKHPGLGTLVSDRSFSTIESVILSHCYAPFKFLGYLLAWIIRKLDFVFDAVTDFKKVTGKKLVIYHKLDHVIPKDASLAKALAEPVDRQIQLYENFDATRALKEKLDHHNTPLKWYTDDQQKPVMPQISRFLFDRTTPNRLNDRLVEAVYNSHKESGIDLTKALNEFFNSFLLTHRERESAMNHFIEDLNEQLEDQRFAEENRLAASQRLIAAEIPSPIPALEQAPLAISEPQPVSPAIVQPAPVELALPRPIPRTAPVVKNSYSDPVPEDDFASYLVQIFDSFVYNSSVIRQGSLI